MDLSYSAPAFFSSAAVSMGEGMLWKMFLVRSERSTAVESVSGTVSLSCCGWSPPQAARAKDARVAQMIWLARMLDLLRIVDERGKGDPHRLGVQWASSQLFP